MTRKKTLALLAILALLAVACTSCKDEELRADVEDLLEEFERESGFPMDYEVKAKTGGGVAVEDFEMVLRQFGQDFITFTADAIKVEAMETGSLGFPEVLKLEIKGLLPEMDEDFLAYVPSEYKELLGKKTDLIVDYALDDDVFEVKTYRMVVEDVLTIEGALKLADVNLRKEEASLDEGRVKYSVHKSFRDDFKDLVGDYADDMEDELDDIDDKDLRKLAEKVVDFLKDPDSIEVSVDADRPVELDEIDRLDEDEIVDALGLKIK